VADRRRALVALAVVAIAAAAAVVHFARGGHGATTYRVDAVFDSGRGVLSGGRVKIAGATVGVVDDVRLTKDRKALVEMRIDKRFAPFRSDAHCSIRVRGLVGDAAVNCQPGTPAGTPLPTGERGRPTVPLAQTSVPVTLTDFFEIWQAPVRDRLRLLLNSLGMGLAGRGDDLNDLLLRANPALVKARRVLAIVVSHRRTLARAITDSARATRELASDRPAIASFVAEAATTSRLTATHERALGAGIAGLPPLLRRSTRALTTLDAINRDGLPVVENLHAAAPPLERLTDGAAPFARAAGPALAAVGPALKAGERTAGLLTPVGRALARFTKSAAPAAALQSELQTNLRDSGAYENLLKVFYYGAASTSRFDAVSHLDPSHLVVSPCALANNATIPEGCDYHYVSQSSPAKNAKRRRPAPGATSAESPAATPKPGGGVQPPSRKPKLPITVPQTGIGPVDDVLGLLDYLLG
jgi:virulence factor Mce-like protein